MIEQKIRYGETGVRYYLDGLRQTLEYYKPKICLEIGTFAGGSAKVFQDYFDNNNIDGLLITCDITPKTLNLKNVVCLQVYPHIYNLSLHNLKLEELLPNSEEIFASVDKNINLISKKLLQYTIAPKFDFVYIDGDHQLLSVDKDYAIAKKLCNGPILLDDTHQLDQWHHDSVDYFNHLKLFNNTYEFQDWTVPVGMGLVL